MRVLSFQLLLSYSVVVNL